MATQDDESSRLSDLNLAVAAELGQRSTPPPPRGVRVAEAVCVASLIAIGLSVWNPLHLYWLPGVLNVLVLVWLFLAAAAVALWRSRERQPRLASAVALGCIGAFWLLVSLVAAESGSDDGPVEEVARSDDGLVVTAQDLGWFDPQYELNLRNDRGLLTRQIRLFTAEYYAPVTVDDDGTVRFEDSYGWLEITVDPATLDILSVTCSAAEATSDPTATSGPTAQCRSIG